MLTTLVLLLASQPTSPARVDTRGHALADLQAGLEQQLAALERCRPPAPSSRAAPVVRTEAVTTLELAVDPSGVVANVRVTTPGSLETKCVERALIKAEFARLPPAATRRSTVVTATLRCEPERCRWSWMPRDATAELARTLGTSRSWTQEMSRFVFSEDGGVTVAAAKAAWVLRGEDIDVTLPEPDGGTARLRFTLDGDGGLLGPSRQLTPH